MRFVFLRSGCSGLVPLLGLLWSLSALANSQFLPLPGAPEMPMEVRQAIDQVWESRSADHEIRTKHLQKDGTPHFANRLILELSPYLNQHAHNPVNWHAWGEEAFELARQLDRPVLISIGYSSCHWCHVMEEESYDNLKIARLLNEHYIAIKVDREINPDIDELYLLAVQIMGGNGGWPLHMFVTPEGKPFLGLVYVPPEDFEVLLNEVHLVWKNDKAELERIANQVTEAVQSFGATSSQDIEIGKMQIDHFVTELFLEEQALDEFSPPSSKFPLESELLLLLDVAIRDNNETALQLAENRLTAMAMGGIRDHVGGGFHRYSVDNEWLVPHFEKMLYNQAHLAQAYLKAFAQTGKNLYRRVAEQTLEYVLRDMRSEEGLFWSATDADSEGGEGTFFLWTVDEIVESVGTDAEFVLNHYGVTEAGNFEGKNILFLSELPEDRASTGKISVESYLDRLSAGVEKLRASRDLRPKPYLDDKVITAWNAMMITTFAQAGSILEDSRYLNAAITAAERIWMHAWNPNEKHLFRILRDNKLSESGKLRDYAYLSQSMLTLYDETGDELWLERGQSIVDSMVEKFWDRQKGGFFSVTESDAVGLIARHKDRFDESLPSGNSVAASSLSSLYRRTGQHIYARLSDQLFQTFAAEIVQIPTSYGYALKALQDHRDGLIGPFEFAGSGSVRVSVRAVGGSDSRILTVVEVALADGWHVQSNQPLADNLVATQVSSVSEDWQLENASYPPADEAYLSFQTDPLSVWSGTVQIPVEFKAADEPDGALQLNLQLQACNDELCLLPENVQLELPLGLVRG